MEKMMRMICLATMLVLALVSDVVAAEKTAVIFRVPAGAKVSIPKGQQNKKKVTTNVVAVLESGGERYWLSTGDHKLTFKLKDLKVGDQGGTGKFLALVYDDSSPPEAYGFGITMAPSISDPKTETDAKKVIREINKPKGAKILAVIDGKAEEVATNSFPLVYEGKIIMVQIMTVEPAPELDVK